MSDRELLEAAARAAGVEIECDAAKAVVFPSHYDGGFSIINSRGGSSLWNPLTDDGDALRLAVKLRFTVQCSFASVWVESAIPELEVVENHNNTDPLAATRRAIVRAAAQIGGYRE